MRILTRRDTGLLTQWTFGTRAGDADALAFLNAASITDPTITAAITNLVIALKNYGIWTKMLAIYPFVGGTAVTHKFNLINPLDTNAAFRLVFTGGWTFSTNGATPNGVNAYADTFLTPSTTMSVNSAHISNYSRTQNIGVSGVQIGCFDGTNELSIYQYFAAISFKGGSLYSYPTDAVRFNNTNTLGFQINTRTAINVAKLHFNGSILSTNSTNRTTNLPSISLLLGASNRTSGIPTQYSPHQLAFASIGSGLTDTEAVNYNTAVVAFQTSLNRNV